MKKFLIVLVSVITLLFLVGYLVAIFVAGPAIAKAVNKYAPELLGCNVTIENINVKPLLNGITVKGVEVRNPEGFKSAHAFKLNSFEASISLKSLLTDTIVIEKVIIDGADVIYEQALKRSNVSVISDNIKKALSLEQSEAKATVVDENLKPETHSNAKKLIIRDFEFKNAQASLVITILGGKGLTLPMPDLKLTDIGAKKGSSGASVASVINETFDAVMSEVTNILGRTGKAAGGSAGKLKDSIKGLMKK